MKGPASSAPPPLGSEGERLWREVETVFADPARHDRFIQHCSGADILPAAARRYRDWLEAHPHADVDEALAKKMIQRITFLAMQPLSQPPRPAPKRLVGNRLMLIVLMGALVGAVFGIFFGRCGITK